MTSGRSTFGIRAAMADCKATRLGGRSSLSSGLSTSSSRSLRRSIPGMGVVRQVGRDLAPGLVEPPGQVAHLCPGIERPVERAANGQACGVPGLTAQQAQPWIGVAHPGWNEHVTPLEPGAECFEDCKDVGTAVGDAASAIEGMALPGWPHELGRRAGHAGLVPVLDAAQVVERGDHRLAGRRRLERGALQQAGEQRAHPPPVRPQFLAAPVVRLGDQAVDAGHGGLDGLPWRSARTKQPSARPAAGRSRHRTRHAGPRRAA